MKLSPTLNLKNKVALITGGSREVGRAIALGLAQEGVTVIIGYLQHGEAAGKILEEIEKEGGKGLLCKIDVTKAAAVKKIIGRFERIDILVNNARGEIIRKPFLETTWEEYQRQIEVMIKGNFCLSQAVAKKMKENGFGRIINILSSITHDSVKGYSSYITPLSAIIGLGRNLALELGEYGITVNNISPGFTLTGETPHAPKEIQRKIAAMTALKRLAGPLDVAKAVLFFASDLSGFVTGENLRLDGGKIL